MVGRVTLNAEQSAGLGWYVCDSWGLSEVIKKRKKSEIGWCATSFMRLGPFSGGAE